MLKSKILFKITGSIACFKAAAVISKLVQSGYEVQVVASKSALQFIGAATFEGLTGKKILSDLWETGTMMEHIRAMRWADAIVVAPASANFINKASGGIADDLIGTMFLAHDFSKPYLVFPAMNTSMYLHPVTQESVSKLKSIGIKILDVSSGVLACGENGLGRLLDVDKIFQEITTALTPPNKNRKILITSGGTQEPIDDVRVISNKSTGSTAAEIADTLITQGIDVTYVHAVSAIQPHKTCSKVSFESFKDLENVLKQELATHHYDAIVHAAAVSDFTVDNSVKGKLSSQNEPIIQLKKNPKLVNLLRDFSINKNIKVIAFKMTATLDPESRKQAVKKIFEQSGSEIVVHNDIHEMDWHNGKHTFHIFKNKNDLNFIEDAHNKSELAKKLYEVII